MPDSRFSRLSTNKISKKVTWVLLLIKELDAVPISYFKKLAGTLEIWECRITSGSNEYRIFSFFDNENLVLTHGYVKKSHKIPKNEIKKAENYRKDYLKRRVKNE